MLEDFNKIIAAFKYWNFNRPLNPIESYNDRFLIQKLAFLCQSLGLNMNYTFGIYLAGPYSKALADDYFAFHENLNGLITPYEPTKTDIEIFGKITEIILNKEVKGGRKMEYLEAVATIQKLLHRGDIESEDELYVQTKEIKPHLSDYIITIALNAVKQLNFKSEYLTDELKEEFDLWDRID